MAGTKPKGAPSGTLLLFSALRRTRSETASSSGSSTRLERKRKAARKAGANWRT